MEIAGILGHYNERGGAQVRGFKSLKHGFWAGVRRRHIRDRSLSRVRQLSLRDAMGGIFSIPGSLSGPSILVFTSPHCDPCKEIYPSIRRLADEGVQLILISRGAIQTNKALRDEHRLDSIPVLGGRSEAEQALGVRGTPWASLLDPDGHIFFSGPADVQVLGALADQANHPMLNRG